MFTFPFIHGFNAMQFPLIDNDGKMVQDVAGEIDD